MSDSLVVAIIGMIVVFTILLIMVGIVMLVGSIFAHFNTKSSNNVKNPNFATNTLTASDINTEIEDGIPDEEVAVITAALTCMLNNGEPKPFAIRSIKRSGRQVNSGNVWNSAGLMESTQPF